MHAVHGVCLLLLMLSSLAHCRTVVQVTFVDYSNPEGLAYTGDCCEDTGSTCQMDCTYSYTLCLGDENEDDNCAGTSIEDFRSDPGNDQTFGADIGTYTNPSDQIVDDWQANYPVKVVVNHISSTGVGEPDTWVDVLVGEITSTPASSEDEATEEELTLTGARTDSPTVLNIKVKVFCDDDFYGDVCGVFCVDTDTCDGHFTCDPATGDKLCSDDYEGPTCQDPKDASAICPSDPFTCQNGGTCITFGDGPEECCCTPGYTGATCEETEDACTDNPCYNGGECVVDGDSFTCNCQPGFYGATCRIFPGQIECTEEPSEEEDIGSYNCTCEEALEPGTCALQEDAPCPENEDCSGTTLPMTTMVTMMTTMLPECNYTDSCEGHYECGIYGEIICLDGWENEDNMCKDRVGYDETTDCIGTQ